MAIWGWYSRAKAMGRVKKDLEAQQTENENWYDKKANEAYLERNESQRVLSHMADQLRNNSKHLAAMQAVGGLSEEAVAAQKAANVNSLGDVLSQMGVQAQGAKETIAAALGHGSQTVTDIYIDFDIKKIDEANRRVIDFVLYNKV